MIKDKWWTAAIDIKEKDLIEVSKFVYEEVESIEYTKTEYPKIVYNLTVEDNHNYYVGEEEVLTHNMTTKKKCNLTKGAAQPTGRMNMAGKTHPVSAVEFDASGFPKFKSE